LQLDTQLAGRELAGLEHTPRGAGPMFSLMYISYIFIATVFNTSVHTKLVLFQT